MVNDYMLDKVLDNTKETVGIVKFYDTNSILQEDDSTTLQYIHLVLFFSLVSFLKIFFSNTTILMQDLQQQII